MAHPLEDVIRQAEGFVASLFPLMGIALPEPDHTTLSRRGSKLQVKLPSVSTDGPVEILIDSTGLRIVEAPKKRRAKGRGWKASAASG